MEPQGRSFYAIVLNHTHKSAHMGAEMMRHLVIATARARYSVAAAVKRVGAGTQAAVAL